MIRKLIALRHTLDRRCAQRTLLLAEMVIAHTGVEWASVDTINLMSRSRAANPARFQVKPMGIAIGFEWHRGTRRRRNDPA